MLFVCSSIKKATVSPTCGCSSTDGEACSPTEKLCSTFASLFSSSVFFSFLKFATSRLRSKFSVKRSAFFFLSLSIFPHTKKRLYSILRAQPLCSAIFASSSTLRCLKTSSSDEKALRRSSGDLSSNIFQKFGQVDHLYRKRSSGNRTGFFQNSSLEQ
ncbi:unnamed protein product [Rhizophagus irregularis]|nr:unnamed protein product [Rhizophagus irregularis]